MAVLTCHTEGCGNAEIPISYDLEWVDENGETQVISTVICGVCGKPITDIEPDG